MSLTPTYRRVRLPGRTGVFLTVVSLLILGGCDWIIGASRPDEAQVLLDGSTPDVIHVITSQNFLMGFSPDDGTREIQFVTADTARVPLPFDQRYDLRNNGWFAVRVMTPVGDTAQVSMRVLLDGDERFNQSTVLTTQFLQFFVTHN